MVKRCIYCNYELGGDSVVDICETCMYKVWGPKMSKAIIDGMKKETEKGNMELGRVSEYVEKKICVESPEIIPVNEVESIEDNSNEFGLL